MISRITRSRSWLTSTRYGGETPQHVYSVSFTAQEVWGQEASARDSLFIDMWDDYLDPLEIPRRIPRWWKKHN